MTGTNKRTSNKSKRLLLPLLLAVSCLGACTRDTLLDKTYDLPRNGWVYTEAVSFDTQVSDTSTGYDWVLSIKHNDTYHWSNAYFLITTIFPDMETHIDTLECILATKDGKWIGSRFGKFHNIGFLYKQDIRFPQTGEYRFEIRQAMREDTLQGIVATGMKISPHQ